MKITTADNAEWEIRPLDPQTDSDEICRIYSWYVDNSTATFETVAPSSEAMELRLRDIVANYPAFVCVEAGRIVGYCYAHLWKSFSAYSQTLETTVYLRPGHNGRGVGKVLMERLTEACRVQGFKSLIACITAENEASCRFHERLGFSRVSHFKEVGYKFNRFLSVVDYQLQL